MSKTDENLLKAIAGESMARNKYTYFAEQATKEGQMWIAQVFEETAGNERAHAQEEYELLKEKTEMTNTYDIIPQASTLDNLKQSISGETHEYTEMYPDFEAIAKVEGNTAAETLFREIKETEEKHAERYTILAGLVENDKLYQSESEIEWKCLNCGYVHKGKEAPKSCPLCKKPQGWYMGLGITR